MERQAVSLCGAVLAALERGERPEEAELVRALRASSCPRELVERLVACRWVLASRQLLLLALLHPGCPRAFALTALGRLGWAELLTIARHPRSAVAVRRQAERRLVEKLPHLTLGERTALARLAPRAVLGAMLEESEPTCIEALLGNACFTEGDAVRLVNANASPACIQAVLRHQRWGVLPEVRRVALRSPRLPLATTLGLLATLTVGELAAVAHGLDAPPGVREAAAKLLARRRQGSGDREPPSCALRDGS